MSNNKECVQHEQGLINAGACGAASPGPAVEGGGGTLE